MSNSNLTIHESVRERYAKIARSVPESTATCCGSEASCGCQSNLYDDVLLEGLHQDIVNLSLGCGDPVTIASLKNGETVLDLGSGGGIDCFMAASQVGMAGSVIGVDMTSEMIEKANKNKTKMGIENVEFRQGQIEDLPVKDNSVDVIMSNCVINLSPQKSLVFAEALRVLKPNGRISISDIVTDGEFSESMRSDMNKWAECVTGAIDVSAYTSIMREAGFVDIEVLDKANADDIIVHQAGMPRVYSARITARKPA
jgi:2-polyprenyl-3-methyl-5-hydroxy-6-metoxy-1,4-benzoquinol methylase